MTSTIVALVSLFLSILFGSLSFISYRGLDK